MLAQLNVQGFELKASCKIMSTFSLYFVVPKLKHYILSVEIFAIAPIDVIKYMLSWPMLSNRIGKWLIGLVKF